MSFQGLINRYLLSDGRKEIYYTTDKVANKIYEDLRGKTASGIEVAIGIILNILGQFPDEVKSFPLVIDSKEFGIL